MTHRTGSRAPSRRPYTKYFQIFITNSAGRIFQRTEIDDRFAHMYPSVSLTECRSDGPERAELRSFDDYYCTFKRRSDGARHVRSTNNDIDVIINPTTTVHSPRSVHRGLRDEVTVWYKRSTTTTTTTYHRIVIFVRILYGIIRVHPV